AQHEGAFPISIKSRSCLLNLNGGSAPPVVNNDIAVCSPGGISFFLEVRLMSALFKVNFVMR
ncbi:hypothetical protein, partial [Escherichia coli]|uniref:hypothetical protein n=2 Tax=Escherichia coli TaxID=562 RepID=UPI0019D37C38